MVENVLDLSLIDAGRIELDLGPVDLAGLVQKVLVMVAQKADAAGVRIEARLGEPPGMIGADARRATQVLLNLVWSSLRFTSHGGTILVEALRRTGMLLLSVQDTGGGAAAADRSAGFEDAFTGTEPAAGMGLAIVKQFVALHGGTVNMDILEGGGVRTTCVLPIEAGASEAG